MPTLEEQQRSGSDQSQVANGFIAPPAGFAQLSLAVLQGKRTVVGFMTGFLCIGIALCIILPREYTATATIFPRPSGQGGVSSMLAQLSPLVSADIGRGMSSDLFVAMLHSQTICKGLNDKFNLQALYHKQTLEKTCKKLESQVQIVNSRKDNVIVISVDDRDANRAAAIANGYIEQLQALNERISFSEADVRAAFYENRLGQAKDDLTEAEIALKASETKTGVIQLDSQARAVVESLARVQATIAEREVALKAMQTYAAADNSELILLETQLDALRAEERKLESSQPTGSSLRSANQLPEVSLEYIRAYREVKYRESLFEALLKQYESARIDEGKSPAVFEVIDRASVPEVAHKPKRAIILTSSVVLGFIFGLCWVAGTYAWRQFLSIPRNRETWMEVRQELKRI
jgi:tyrosine-protein kinase Etk/Wzc